MCVALKKVLRLHNKTLAGSGFFFVFFLGGGGEYEMCFADCYCTMMFITVENL